MGGSMDNNRIPRYSLVEVAKRSEIRCELCAYDLRRRPYHIHHLNGDQKSTIPENLLMICPTCYTEIHKKS